MSVFYLYLGAASAVCAYQWALATAGAGMRHLRVGLGMMTFAMFIGVGYTVSRTLFLWASVIDTPSESFALRFDEVTEAAQVVLFAFFAVGASIPALSKGQRRAKLWRAQVKLHGLWRELMTAFPEQPFDPPASLVRELTRFDTPADLRIDRWAADIADAVEKLRHYVPDTLLPAAKAAAAGGTAAHHTVADGTTGDADRAGPLAEAYWIKAALTAKNNGAPASTAATVETQHATDQDGEVAWLVRVATAYRTVPQDRAAQVLAHATSATPITSATPATSAATTGPSTASATTGPAARTAAPEETA